MDAIDPADRRLVEAVVAGEAEAWARLRARTDRVVGACFNDVARAAPWLREHEADLLQAFELMLIEGDHRVLRSYAGRAALTTWIHVIATRFFRRQAGAIKAAGGRRAPLDRDERADPRPSVEADLLHRERLAEIRAEVGRLPPDDRLLLALLFDQALNASEVAQVVGLTPSGVRMRKARLLARLAARLGRR